MFSRANSSSKIGCNLLVDDDCDLRVVGRDARLDCSSRLYPLQLD